VIIARNPRDEGVVLLLVMVLIVVSISIAYATAKTSAVDVLSARQREHLGRAQVLARSGLAIATRALLDDAQAQEAVSQVEGPLDAWALLGRQPIELEDGGVLDIQVRDSGARISINALLDPEGKRVGQDVEDKSLAFLDAALETIVEANPDLRQIGLSDERRGELADAILDWIDSDDVTRLGSPEATAYERADGKPLDRRLLSLDELATVPGMDPLLLDALKAYFSPYPRYPTEGSGGGINPNTAPPHVLSLLYYGTLDMRMASEDIVFHLLKVREEGHVFCSAAGASDKCLDFASELRLEGQVFPPLQFTSSVFHVDVEARYQNARACVHAVIDRAFPQTPAILLQRLDC
jgi:type II secretory pathway component PulK